MSEGKFFASFICVMIGVILGITACGVAIYNNLAFPGVVARTEQLRRDASYVSPGQAEDVIGQVTELNQKIRVMQAYNRKWWADWAVPDGWDRLRTIPVPKKYR